MFKKVILTFVVCSLTLPAWAASDDLFNFSKKQEEALIVKVVSSDTIVLENGNRLKLIGVESAGPPPKKYVKYDEHGKPIPEETDSQEIPVISLQEQAIVYAQDLLEGKKVRIEYDVESRSADGYLYAYVYLPDGRMANTELLRMGFVRLRIIPPNIKHEEELRDAYKQAKKEKRGLEGE